MDTYWIFDFTVHYFSISSIFLFITYMAKNILIVTAFRKKFQIFLFHHKAALFKPFHYLYGIFIPKCYSYFEISQDFSTPIFHSNSSIPNNHKKTLVADTFCPAPKKIDLVNSVVETAATLFLCLADIAPGSSSQAFP